MLNTSANSHTMRPGTGNSTARWRGHPNGDLHLPHDNVQLWCKFASVDRIIIKDLLLRGIVGINEDERTNRQDILINVTMWADTAAAATSDDIVDAVNYRTVTKGIISHVEGGQPMLVERLVQEVADICFDADERVAEVEVTVEKPGALRFARSVGITIRRSRSS